MCFYQIYFPKVLSCFSKKRRDKEAYLKGKLEKEKLLREKMDMNVNGESDSFRSKPHIRKSAY